jgi:8-amino-7-oxononanoate synthase
MLFDKFQAMADFQAELAQRQVTPFGAVTEKILSATEGIVEGRRVILAGTNNYLGLSYDPRCIKAAQDAAQQWGTGTTGSRLANGSFAEHQALESEIAAFYGLDHAIVFSTGYAATMGMCATLAGPGDVILMDADSHASIYSGVKQSGAEIIRFKHSNPEDLAKRMRRLGDRAGQALIIAEGIYSMLGDVAPLQEIAAIKREYGGYLLLDEAHSMGALGDTGRGAAQAAGVEADVDFTVGTFTTRGAAHHRPGTGATHPAVGKRQPTVPGPEIPWSGSRPYRQPGGCSGNGRSLPDYRLLESTAGGRRLR